MASPIGSNRRLELQRSTPFKDEADKGKTLEVAMAVTIFKKLQDGGLIPASARLASEVPAAKGLKSTSYEARLVELIKDSDGNGQLDLDLEALATSKLLPGAHTAADLEAVLAGRVAGGIPDEFFRDQRSNSELSQAGQPNGRAKEVQAYATGMVLTREEDRISAAFLADAATRASLSPEGGKAVASEALAAAQVLVNQGQPGKARAHLESIGNALIDSGRLGDARKIFEELTRAPHAAVPRNLIQDAIDDMKAGNPHFDEHSQRIPTPPTENGNTLVLNANDYASTVGDAAKVKLSQIAVEERMTAALGRPVDPYSMADAGAYLQAFSKGKDAAAVGQEYQSYLKAFYKHAGHGVEWTSKIPQDERAGRLDELFEGQPCDDTWRKIVDCEGFAYLTDRLLGGLENPDGSKRFEVTYATRPGHIITGVSEAATRQFFTVNNDVVASPAVARSPRAEQERIAASLYPGTPGVVRLGSTQTEAQVQSGRSPLSPPKVGSLLWNGRSVVGEVTEGAQARFLANAQRTGATTYEAWVPSEVK